MQTNRLVPTWTFTFEGKILPSSLKLVCCVISPEEEELQSNGQSEIGNTANTGPLHYNVFGFHVSVGYLGFNSTASSVERRVQMFQTGDYA